MMMRPIHIPILPTLVTLFAVFTTLESLVIPLPAATPAESLKGVVLERLSDGERVDLGLTWARLCRRQYQGPKR